MPNNAVDFLPEDYVEKRAQNRAAILFTGLFVLVMGGVIGYYMMKQPALRAAQAEAMRLDQELEGKGKQILQAQEMEREKQRMMNKAEVTAMLLERVPRNILFAEYTRLAPKGVSMLTMELKSKEGVARPATPLEAAKAAADQASGAAAPPKLAPPIVEVMVTGMAPTDGHVATFIESLGKSRLLSDVNLMYSEEFKHNDTPLRRFKVEMKINPSADLRPGMDSSVARD